MIQADYTNLVSPSRSIKAKVELYSGSTLVNTFNYNDSLISIDIERVGEEGKFFGFGICQKATLKLRDPYKNYLFDTSLSFKVYFSAGTEADYIDNFPIFYIKELNRDEKTNQLTITAYDALYDAANHTVSELGLTKYTVRGFVNSCSKFLGLGDVLKVVNGSAETEECFTRAYGSGANFEGTESLRTALTAVAESTQTIYYVRADNYLVFRRLNKNTTPDYTIDDNNYMELESKTTHTLAAIHHVTELGDNVEASTSGTGEVQFVRNNPFWELRTDIDTLLTTAIDTIGGLTIGQVNCKWRGNYLLEIGDRINFSKKGALVASSFLLNDTISYNGGLTETTSWSYTGNKEETASNPATLGDALNLTFARVDKVNKEIELMASEVDANATAISSLQINTDGIAASVETLATSTETAVEGANENIADLYNKVELAMTSEDVTLAIQEEISNGVDKVQTSTGFTFNDEGLTIEKTNREMKTQITENGMTVYKNNEAILTANNVGVDAVNLHATTYLIIGDNSRFEDMGSNRTGCFWIGG
jgi:hypothetical protein